jgi:hypothetical protein
VQHYHTHSLSIITVLVQHHHSISAALSHPFTQQHHISPPHYHINTFVPPQVLDETTGRPLQHVLRAQPIDGPLDGCRWLDDGTDLEYIYFDVQANQPAKLFKFMTSQSERCPPQGCPPLI